MRFFNAIFRAGPDDDGIVRGRAGARRWLLQLSGLFLFGFICAATLLSFFLQRRLVSFIAALVTCGLLGLALRLFVQPCAWLGFDWNPPILFNAGAGHLEVRAWEKCMLKTRVVSASTLQDLQVFRASAACASNPCFSELTALHEAAALEKELPHTGDAAREIRLALTQFFATTRPQATVACGLLAAKLQGEEEQPLLLSRCSWSRSGVDELCMLATAARRQLSMPEKALLLPGSLGPPMQSLEAEEDPAVRVDEHEVQQHSLGLPRVPSNPSSLSSLPEQPVESLRPPSGCGVQFPRVVHVADSNFPPNS